MAAPGERCAVPRRGQVLARLCSLALSLAPPTMSADYLPAIRPERPAWNKGRIIGQKRPLLPKHVWSIRIRLEMADNRRDLAWFNMAIDSKLRGCGLVRRSTTYSRRDG
jgi:hypothetical protein